MKKKIRRIQLNRETIRQLDPPQLDQAGALGTATACSGGCPLTAPRLTIDACGPQGNGGPKQV